MNLMSWDWLFRACEVVSIVAGAVAVAALIGQVVSGRVLSDRKEVEMQNLRLDVAKQQERAANAEKQLEQVRQRQDPRAFAVAALIKALIDKPPGMAEILYEEGDPEVFEFAGYLERCLHSTGWDVRAPRPIGNTVNGVFASAGFPDLNSWPPTMRLGAASTGVSIIMNVNTAATVETNPQFKKPFDTLVGAFNAASIRVRPTPIQPDPALPDGMFRIVIAPR